MRDFAGALVGLAWQQQRRASFLGWLSPTRLALSRMRRSISPPSTTTTTTACARVLRLCALWRGGRASPVGALRAQADGGGARRALHPRVGTAVRDRDTFARSPARHFLTSLTSSSPCRWRVAVLGLHRYDVGHFVAEHCDPGTLPSLSHARAGWTWPISRVLVGLVRALLLRGR